MTRFEKIRYWIPAGFWLVIMFIMSSVSIEPGSKRNIIGFIVQSLKHYFMSSSISVLQFIGLHSDKVYHGFEYAVFTVLVYFAMLKTYRFTMKKNLTIIFGSSVVIAAVDELHQRITPGRIPQISDFIADLTGVGIIIIIIIIVRSVRRRNALQKD